VTGACCYNLDVTRTFTILLLAASSCLAAELKPEAIQAYDKYTKEIDARWTANKTPFLWADASPERLAKVKKGDIVVEPWKGDGDTFPPNSSASIHDWIGSVFIPGVTLQKVLGALQDYDHHKSIYPGVPDSKLLTHNGNDWTYRRLRQLNNGPVHGVFRQDFAAHYQEVDPTRWICLTHTTLVDEIEDYGKPKQKELPVGKGSGYLWKLNGYWRLEERDGGVYLECESTTLTRGLPPIIGALFVSSTHALERDGLTDTLRATRDAAKK